MDDTDARKYTIKFPLICVRQSIRFFALIALSSALWFLFQLDVVTDQREHVNHIRLKGR